MKKYKKIICTIVIAVVTILNTAIITEAHSGRTDASGGHRDNKNVSGLGGYHYHHGYGPHLHTNGCPYEGGGVATSNRDEEIELEKKNAYNDGYNQGHDQGYRNLSDGYKNYSGSYRSNYNSGYDDGYKKGQEDFEKDKKSAYNKGKKEGQKGIEVSNPYSNKEFAVKYEEGYKDGYKEYKENKIAEYSKLGIKDGKEDKDMIDLSTIKDEDIVKSYKDGYNKEQEVVRLVYFKEGYNIALKGKSSNDSNYKKDRHKIWYGEGYNEGKIKLEELKSAAYDDGFNKKEFELEDQDKDAIDICKVEYNLGVQARENRDENIKVGTIIALLIGAGGFGVYKYKKK